MWSGHSCPLPLNLVLLLHLILRATDSQTGPPKPFHLVILSNAKDLSNSPQSA
jgi:hypothetical protein